MDFPVRIRVRMPRPTPKRLASDIPFWLLTQCGRDGFASYHMDTEAGAFEMFYFRQLDLAQAFLAAFPELKLAQGPT